jgi:aspartokinase/homoserine dehydrogenase 1
MPDKEILVLKFGGSSLANSERIATVMEIIRSHARKHPVVAVVSAMAGVTDRLLGVGQHALRGKQRLVRAEIESLRALHETSFSALAPNRRVKSWITHFLERRFAEIDAVAHGIFLIREFSDRTRDKLLAFGEIISSRLLAGVLEAHNDGHFRHSDARSWIAGSWTPQGTVVDFSRTEELVIEKLQPILAKGSSAVVPGFICRDTDGETATLGRNGSDYSAAIIGAALRAKAIWIYTDVDGVMSADPNLVAEAASLAQISYQEAAEMSYFGGKVLHPKTIIPAVVRNIPIRIKNTFNPRAKGTLVTDRAGTSPLVKTVTSVRQLALLNIQGNGMVVIPRATSRLFEVLARENIDVMMISQSSSEYSICIVIQTRDSSRAAKALQSEFQFELERNLMEKVEVTQGVAIVSIIGAGMRGTPGTSGKFFEALGKCRVNVLAIAQGSSERNISAAIWEKDVQNAVQTIHSAFGLTRDLHVFLFGCGNIGRALLKQIHESRKQLASRLQVNLKVLGVANSKTWRFAPTGMTGAELETLGSALPLGQLQGSERRPSFTEIFDRLAATYRSDVVLVDATGAELAAMHIEGLRRGFHIVTANKRPLTSSLVEYLEIQDLKRRKGLNYQYEATFGAGLPLLATLQDLLDTGDTVLQIQGCLSGTLGFICSRLDDSIPLSSAVEEAMKLGYTEPDPRDDLSGMDVARKSLIIARALGHRLEPSEIRLKSMVPKKFFRAASVADFLHRLRAADEQISLDVRKAHERNEVLRYIIDIRGEVYQVGLRSVPRDSPIGRLGGPDNILVFRTQRYSDYPLVIQGPGAGAGVTAAGVLSDLLKIAKWI